MKRVRLLILLTSSLIVTGCASKNSCSVSDKTKVEITSPESKPYHTRITPIIGTKTNDEKVMRDFGVILRATVFPYENTNKDLVDMHNIRIVVKEPKWVIGETLPVKRKKGVLSYKGDFPYTLRNSELDKNNVVDEKTIVEFQNNLNNINKNPQSIKERLEADAYDSEIKKFLEDSKKGAF